MIVGMYVIVFGDLMENLDHRTGWTVYLIFESVNTYNYIARTNPKRAIEI